jgi:hypothetical protein
MKEGEILENCIADHNMKAGSGRKLKNRNQRYSIFKKKIYL